MKTKKLIILLFLGLFLAFFVSGCKDIKGIYLKDDIKEIYLKNIKDIHLKDLYSEKTGNLKIVINWDDFNNINVQSSNSKNISKINKSDRVTHMGARVVYTSGSASFSQSVERKTFEKKGIIIFNIPSTDSAKLYVIAVHYSGQAYNHEENKVLWFGVVNNISIPSDGIVEITMDDIDWIPATWYPGKGYEDYVLGLKASKYEKYYDFPIYVRDPFQVGENPISYDELYVKILGRSGPGENTNGWRKFTIRSENHSIGEAHKDVYKFQPYVEPTYFNLDMALAYSIPPIVRFYIISWE